MRVALVYDRLNKVGGAEAVLIQFAKLFPSADWYTSVWDPKLTPFTKGWNIHTSWLNRIPLLRTHHEWIPFLMPFVFEAFDLSTYELVISIGSAEAKGIITKPGILHINYCLTPTRYLYSHAAQYLSNPLYRYIGKLLRRWDLVAATRPDIMIAISTQVKKRIKDVYKRNAEVIYPPVEVEKFTKKSSVIPAYKNYYLTVSRLVKYKKIDVLINAFNQSGKTLVIVGKGAERARLQRIAKSNIHFTDQVADPELVGYYEHCRAFVQANEEDFGIAMCEAQAAGKPVIAYAKGGAVDIVQDRKTGLLVQSSTALAFREAVDRFETMTFAPSHCRQNADRFDTSIWEKSIKERIDKLWQTQQITKK
jgi:glycosyltransferase involved in cell wall biosynthesis